SQTPPMFSALKRDGVPLYKLARRGIEVERAPRSITIHALALHPVDATGVAFAVECSKGTYVRVLAADVGRALGTVAHLERLRRTQVGAFRLEDASALDALLALPPGSALPLLPVRTALAGYPAFPASPEGLAQLRLGQQEPLAPLPAPSGPGPTAPAPDAPAAVAARRARRRRRPPT